MKSILNFFLRSFIAVNITIIIGLVAFFGFDATIWISLFIGILGGIISNYFLKWRFHQRFLKENQLSSKDYIYIKNNLKEAHLKIKRLNKALLGVRSIHSARQLSKLNRIASKIYLIVKKEPRRFYQSERFFFYHLDSIVELSEQYVFLTKQQINDPQVRRSLSDAEQTLDNLIKSTNDDLLLLLSNDINQLNLELDVAKQTITRENNFFPKERS
ncbi:5-bromo-4-chloroindolyl phosphate hydrolysis family protein [Calidifontibacillus oryziterrae]|uniref:5-bromo-4-chloroindolyl phosphate hydrolysis family protein n=1 Tax=Calidifontibacillus oryziterrae TaxID=1191699 RepID=UPI000304F9EF|nr:5-bromo-4-chloroindolyl phosphate hydrolysis family protein [Calidifontibacillus oryziterrae]